MTATPGRAGWGIAAAIAVVALFVRLAWSMALPPLSGPDEHTHLSYVRFLAAEARTPTRAELDARQGGLYATGSPLPYIAPAALARAFGADRSGWIRLGSVVAGALSVLVLARVARAVAPGPTRTEAACRVGIPLFAALHPQLTFVGAYLNADAFTVLAACVEVRIWCYGRDWFRLRHALHQGGTWALLLLGKPTGLVLLPFSAALWAARLAHMPKEERSGAITTLAAATLLAAAAAVPWFAFNAARLDGDWLGASTMFSWYRVDEPQIGPSLWAGGMGFGGLWLRTDWIERSFESSWGVFGCMEHFLRPPGYLVAALLTVITLAAHFSSRSPLSTWQRATFASVILAAMLASSYSSLHNDYQPQGRYLFAAFAPFTLLMFTGARSWARRWKRPWIAPALLVGLAAALHVEAVVRFVVPIARGEMESCGVVAAASEEEP